MKKGICKKNPNGWEIEYEELQPHAGVSKMGTGPGAGKKIYVTKTIPVHPSDFKFCEEGQELEFNEYLEYIEPPDDIHPNRGGHKLLAKISSWEVMRKLFDTGRFPDRDIDHIINTLKDNFFEPGRK